MLPQLIKSRIKQHVLKNCSRAQAGWRFANQDEDTITGDFFGYLCTRDEWRYTGEFEWKLSYNKVRGRGQGALEKKVGTDGIITIVYHDRVTKEDTYKSLVFQAKKEGNSVNHSQWDLMKTYFPGGNMIVTYGPTGYRAMSSTTEGNLGLCQIIANQFLECKIGIVGLYYDDETNQFVRPRGLPISGSVDHKLLIEVFRNNNAF